MVKKAWVNLMLRRMRASSLVIPYIAKPLGYTTKEP